MDCAMPASAAASPEFAGALALEGQREDEARAAADSEQGACQDGQRGGGDQYGEAACHEDRGPGRGPALVVAGPG